MASRSGRQYVDHPAPSAGFMAVLTIVLGALLVAITALVRESLHDAPAGPAWIAILLGLGVVCFYFWPLYSTYYTVSETGLEVRYGPWTRSYPWSDFVTAYWQRGMFATRIGWPSVTPCVRLTDCVLLKRKARRFGLYLTPNEPKAFLHRIAEFAPELTSELIL
jgi:hypothetical protein